VTSSELARRAGVSVQHLNRLVRDGLASPSVRRSRKQGSRAEWSDEDAVAVSAMVAARRQLVALGRSPIPPIRLSRLGNADLLGVGIAEGEVVAVTPRTTVAQLLRALGGAFAVIPQEAP